MKKTQLLTAEELEAEIEKAKGLPVKDYSDDSPGVCVIQGINRQKPSLMILGISSRDAALTFNGRDWQTVLIQNSVINTVDLDHVDLGVQDSEIRVIGLNNEKGDDKVAYLLSISNSKIGSLRSMKGGDFTQVDFENSSFERLDLGKINYVGQGHIDWRKLSIKGSLRVSFENEASIDSIRCSESLASFIRLVCPRVPLEVFRCE